MSRIDLHLHTIHSDGSLSPAEVLKLAAKASVTALAITDHDITSGIPEAMATGRGILELIREKKILTEKQIAEVLDPAAMTGQGRPV